MLIRIFNTLRSRIWDRGLFLFLCFGSRRNKCNSLWGEKGKEIRKLPLAQKVILSEAYFSLIYCDNIMINLSYTVITGDIILSSLPSSRRQYQNKPRPSDLSPFLSKNYFIHSFRSQNTENKKNRLLQM